MADQIILPLQGLLRQPKIGFWRNFPGTNYFELKSLQHSVPHKLWDKFPTLATEMYFLPYFLYFIHSGANLLYEAYSKSKVDVFKLIFRFCMSNFNWEWEYSTHHSGSVMSQLKFDMQKRDISLKTSTLCQKLEWW